MHMNLCFYKKKLYKNPKLYWNLEEKEKKSEILCFDHFIENTDSLITVHCIQSMTIKALVNDFFIKW